MRTKTRYRKFQTGGAVTPIADEVTPVPGVTPQGKSELADVPSFDSPAVTGLAGDDASQAFQQQIAALHRSEQSQRDRAAQTAAAPQPSLPQSLPDGREERIALWRQHGMTQQQADWLRENPRMIDRADLTGMATGLADRDGYKPDDPQYFEAVKHHFNGLSEHEEQQHHRAGERNPAQQPTPKFFEPPALPSRPDRSSIVSAPVSRDIPSSNRSERGSSGRITLSPQQKEAAKISGVTEVQYAANLAELAARKESGYYDR